MLKVNVLVFALLFVVAVIFCFLVALNTHQSGRVFWHYKVRYREENNFTKA